MKKQLSKYYIFIPVLFFISCRSNKNLNDPSYKFSENGNLEYLVYDSDEGKNSKTITSDNLIYSGDKKVLWKDSLSQKEDFEVLELISNNVILNRIPIIETRIGTRDMAPYEFSLTVLDFMDFINFEKGIVRRVYLND